MYLSILANNTYCIAESLANNNSCMNTCQNIDYSWCKLFMAYEEFVTIINYYFL